MCAMSGAVAWRRRAGASSSWRGRRVFGDCEAHRHEAHRQSPNPCIPHAALQHISSGGRPCTLEALAMDAARTSPNDHEVTPAVVPGGAARQITPDIAGVSETMLWALHNRASEARRRDGILVDPDCVRIHEAIDYDFERQFGDPVGSLAVRAAEIDRALRRWRERHPNGFVVSLGEGLETQVRRVDNGRVRWLSVDLPNAIRLRECFLAPTDRFHHIGVSALDVTWMDAVDPSSGVFIVAQGLLMYLESEAVHRL